MNPEELLRPLAAVVLAATLTSCTLDAPDARTAGEAATSTRAQDRGGDDGGRVLYTGVSEARIGMAGLDGSDAHLLWPDLGEGDQTNADWSPTGSRVVFVANDGERDDLWIAEVDGGEPRLLLDCARACRWLDDPSWSPNGREVVYSRTVERGGRGLGSLETVDVDSGAVSVLVPPRARTFTAGARWSPFGSFVVYESVRKTHPGLDAAVDGVALRVVRPGFPPGPRLTDPRLFAATADWSPDGTSIVYTALPERGAAATDLFTIDPEGGTPRRVTYLADAGGFAQEPTWRADSRTLVFSGRLADRTGSPVLLTAGATGVPAPTELGGRAVIGRHPRVEPGH